MLPTLAPLTLLAALAATILPSPADAQPAPPPNLVLWMTDDISYVNYSFAGASVSTRRIAKLGRDGIIYKKAWSNAICRPTRAMLMTGHYATETGWWGQNHVAPTNLGTDIGTFGNLAKSQGYRTLMVGKWQLKGRAAEAGFDHYCMWEHSDVRSKVLLREDFVNFSNGPVFDPADRAGKGVQNRYWHPLIVKHFWPAEHEMLITSPADFGPNIFVQCIQDFMKVNKSQPFFVYWAGVTAHQHWDEVVQDQAFIGMPIVSKIDIMNIDGREPEGTGSLASNIEYVDKMAGFLKKVIREEGHFDNTIFVFTSDNGSHGFGKGQTTSEEGVHVPVIVWGGLVKKRGKTGRLFSLVDIYNTFSDLMGAGVDPSRPNSYSWAKYWKGESNAVVRRWMIGYRGEEDQNGVIQPNLVVRNTRFIRDSNDDLWDCSGGRDERTCEMVDSNDFLTEYNKLGQKVDDIMTNGFSDAKIF